MAGTETVTVTTAIIGLLAVGGRLSDVIWDLNLPSTKLTPMLNQALQQVKQCRSTVHILCKTLSLLETAQLPLPERAGWIDVEDVVATLTDTVLALSDLQTLCAVLEEQKRSGVTAGTEPHEAAECDWDRRIGALCSRIRWHNLSMTMMMTILKCPGESDAHNALLGLERRVARLVTSNMALAGRMRRLDHICDPQPQDLPPHYTPRGRLPQRQPPPMSTTPRPATDGTGLGIESMAAPSNIGAPPSPTRVSTPLSGLALADMPILSAIPLPITTNELFDGNEVYTFAYARLVGPDLVELMQSEAGPGTSRSLSVVLGRTNTDNGSAGGTTASASMSTATTIGTGSSNDGTAPAVTAGLPPAKKAKKPRFRKICTKRIIKWRT
ncbi:hypothetical protein DCS_03523 [Drechmeria coniospora]|uniref:Fungal N-terminal domain-containing protein n=1 Tax=Drechmeria coniospora TaxID=98403 RepID=A0A151GHC6_DRECN|nr:hypothetical protein DCS_03523 [Drechmeria coniospora]KYK56523.1 hypothetical protein DCS_03523 [Drechmeria coniospora]